MANVVETVFAVQDDFSGAVDRLASAITRLEGKIQGAAPAVDRMGNAMRDAGVDASAFDKQAKALDRTLDALDGRRVRVKVDQVGGVAVPGSGIGSKLSQAAGATEQQLRGVMAVTNALPASLQGVTVAANNTATAVSAIAASSPVATAAVLGLGAVVAGLIGGFRLAERLADEGEELKNFSAQLGISERNLQGIRQAFREAGVDAGALETGIRILNQKVSEGSPVLKALGVSARDPFTAFIQLGDAFKRTQGLAVQSALATELFGRAGTRLIPIMNQGSAALLENVQSMSALVAHSDDGITALGRLDSSVDKIKTNMEAFRVNVVDAIAPSLANVADAALRLGDVFERIAALTGVRGLFTEMGDDANDLSRDFDALAIHGQLLIDTIDLAGDALQTFLKVGQNPQGLAGLKGEMDAIAARAKALRSFSAASFGDKGDLPVADGGALGIEGITRALRDFATARQLKTFDTAAITAFTAEATKAGIEVGLISEKMKEAALAAAREDQFLSALLQSTKNTKDGTKTAADAFAAFSTEIDHATKLTPAFLDGLARAFAISGNRLQVFKSVEGDAAAAKKVILDLAPAFEPAVTQARALGEALNISTRAALELVEAVDKIKPPEIEPRGERPKPPPVADVGPLVPVPEPRMQTLTEQFDWADRLVLELQDAAAQMNPILDGMHAGIQAVFDGIESSIDQWVSSWKGVPSIVRQVVAEILAEIAKLIVIKSILAVLPGGASQGLSMDPLFGGRKSSSKVDPRGDLSSGPVAPASSAPSFDLGALPKSIPVAVPPPLAVAPAPPVEMVVTFPPLPAFPTLPALTVADPAPVRMTVDVPAVAAPASIPVDVPAVTVTVPDVRADVALTLPPIPEVRVTATATAPTIPPVAVAVSVPTLGVEIPPPLPVAEPPALAVAVPPPLAVAAVPPVAVALSLPALQVPEIPALAVADLPTLRVAVDVPAAVPPASIPVTVPAIVATVPDVRAEVAVTLPEVPELRITAAATVPEIPAVRVAVDVPTVGVRVPEPLAVAEVPALAVAIPPPLAVADAPPVSVAVALPALAVPDLPALTVADPPPVRIDVAVPEIPAPDVRVTVPEAVAQVPDVRAAVEVTLPPLPVLEVAVPEIAAPEFPAMSVAVDAPTLAVEAVPPLRVADVDPVRVLAPASVPVEAPGSIPVDAPAPSVKLPTFPRLEVGAAPTLAVPPVTVDAPRSIPIDLPAIDMPALNATVRVDVPDIKAPTINAPEIQVASVPPVRVDLGGTIEAPALPALEVGRVPEIAVDVPGSIPVDAPASIPLRVPDLSVTAPDVVARLDARPLSAALASIGKVAQGPPLPAIESPTVRIVRATDTVRESRTEISRLTERATESAAVIPDLSGAFSGLAAAASAIRVVAPSPVAANPIPAPPVPVAVAVPIAAQATIVAQQRTPENAAPVDQRTFVINAINSRDALAEILSPTGSFRRANDRIAELGDA